MASGGPAAAGLAAASATTTSSRAARPPSPFHLPQVGATVAPATDWGDAWWERAFDGAAKRSTASTGGAKRGGGKEKKGSSSSSSSSSFTSSSSSSFSSSSDSDASAPAPRTHRDGTATTATDAEMKLAARLAKDAWGRFGGRSGKMARIAAQEAAAAEAARARLESAATAGGVTVAPARAAGKGKKSHTINARPDAKAGLGAAEASTTRAKKKARAASPAQPATPPFAPLPGWWGATLFVHAGRLEGLDPTARERTAFTEADQLAAATGGVAKGNRRGLGAATAGRIGADWAGKKVCFGDDDDEEAGAPAPAAAASSRPVKWKKLALAALSASPKGRLPLAKLAARVRAAAGPAAAASLADLDAQLRASAKFVVDAKGRVVQAGKG